MAQSYDQPQASILSSNSEQSAKFKFDLYKETKLVENKKERFFFFNNKKLKDKSLFLIGSFLTQKIHETTANFA